MIQLLCADIMLQIFFSCKQQKFVSHTSGGWKVQDQGVSKFGV